MKTSTRASADDAVVATAVGAYTTIITILKKFKELINWQKKKIY